MFAKKVVTNVIDEESSDDEFERYVNNCDDLCFTCGRKGHYASNCYAKTDLNGNYINNDSDDSDDDNDNYGICCFKCGRPGHYATNCYAKTDVHGKYLKRY